MRLGEWSKLYKSEMITPVPKTFPPRSVDELRNISGLLTFNKVAEKLVAELMISEMKKCLDPSQYANQKGISLQHYLIKMIHQILSDTDNNSKGEVTAVLATLYDWKEAFPRQCPKLGVEAFMKCGVRPSLIPLIINYLQDRSMKVKWHGKVSTKRLLNGGGPQGATFGIWEYLAQSNNNSDCVDPDYRYKFVDDLTVLEKINLLIIGLASFNSKITVPSNIPAHNQFIPAEHLKSQSYLQDIQEWTENQKMILNLNKTKVMIFNSTDNYQFGAELSLNDNKLEVVQKTKLLGVVITNDLKWNENTNFIVKRANIRLELLRKVSSFGTSIEEMKNIYVLYIRSVLEQSCVVWHSRLTEENSHDLERVQKAAMKIILGNKYNEYENALEMINLEKLSERRRNLCLKFAQNCLKNEKTKDMFKLNAKSNPMNTRFHEEFEVKYANTGRLKISAIPYMQRLLNDDLVNNPEKYQTKKVRRPG